MDTVKFLRIPLSMIDYVGDLDAFQGLTAEQLASLPDEYTPDETAGIVASLRFAAEHPEFDFAALLPGISASNGQIHVFLVKIYRSFQEAGLAPA
ncbi:hypothetical protein [Paracidovorax valerianellae]|uniref:Uncharacterized protein n=1 Tax=Paracidovorax valerianellae TaxID=187868 RepID=A0A1G6PHK0_9BURK|nr:hypothetical protein [Paracidovorax valerianellae]MDA8444869.1 hypothetical protein [Paracidovorax valerianellae]SDC78976.1 hypothetical protein SAMN05192589_103229 [Paracidovorax valerianellae]